jgi:hypothetical protein
LKANPDAHGGFTGA